MGKKNNKWTSKMYPNLHDNVMDAVSHTISSMTFEANPNATPQRTYSTHVMGKFQCTNEGCSQVSWGSKKVAILIRFFSGDCYNAEVFLQRCRSCNSLGDFTLDEESYVERVVYRLNKWAGLVVSEQTYQKKQGPPHKSDLCEGCKRGVCKEGDGSYDDLVEHFSRAL